MKYYFCKFKCMNVNKILLLSLVVLTACQKNDIKVYRIAKTKVDSISNNVTTIQNSEFAWDLPISWTPSSGSKMRLASFDVPYSFGVGDLSVMVLAGDGGGIQANINRWRGQINLPPQPLNEILSLSEKRENRFSDYNLFTLINISKMDQAFISAIMPLDNNTIFVKLNIHANGIKEVKEDFLSFCDSFRLKDE